MDDAGARVVGTQCEALLFQQMLAPMTCSFGELADVVTPAFAEAIASADRGGFAASVAAVLERRDG